MKSLLTLLAGLGCICFSFYLLRSSPTRLEDSLKFDQFLYKFGANSSTTSVTAKMRLKNLGKRNLDLIALIDSCTCISSGFKKGILPAGDTLEFEIQWKLAGYNGLTRLPVRVMANFEGSYHTIQATSFLECEVIPEVCFDTEFMEVSLLNSNEVNIPISLAAGVKIDRVVASHKSIQAFFNKNGSALNVLMNPTELKSVNEISLSVYTESGVPYRFKIFLNRGK